MAEEFQSLNILISGAEDTGQQIKLKDQNRKTYSFFKNKKDGDPTVAFSDYQNFNIGDTVNINYKEVPFKDGIIRNILNIRPATGPAEPVLQTPLAFSRRRQEKPGREYWEKREANRQSSILAQVSFKAAVELEAANVQNGQEMDKFRIYNNALEFYDWLRGQIGEEEITNEKQTQKVNIDHSESEDIGF